MPCHVDAAIDILILLMLHSRRHAATGIADDILRQAPTPCRYALMPLPYAALIDAASRSAR